MFDLQDMISELEEYYECAGFADIYDKVLKDMSEEEIKDYFHKTFFVNEEVSEQENEAWRKSWFSEDIDRTK